MTISLSRDMMRQMKLEDEGTVMLDTFSRRRPVYGSITVLGVLLANCNSTPEHTHGTVKSPCIEPCHQLELAAILDDLLVSISGNPSHFRRG